jgi:hypothetical protein
MCPQNADIQVRHHRQPAAYNDRLDVSAIALGEYETARISVLYQLTSLYSREYPLFRGVEANCWRCSWVSSECRLLHPAGQAARHVTVRQALPGRAVRPERGSVPVVDHHAADTLEVEITLK